MQEWRCSSDGPETTRKLGEELGRRIEEDLAIFLEGDLGSGKTCLTQGLAAGLGVPADEPVTSPTYTLMNHYRGRRELYHFDLYRLAGAVELEDIGFEEYAAAAGVIVVEWARRGIAGDRPGLHVHLQHAGDDRRTLNFAAQGTAAGRLLAALAAGWKSSGEEP